VVLLAPDCASSALAGRISRLAGGGLPRALARADTHLTVISRTL